MSWWKECQIENNEDRNAQNSRIRKLRALSELLKYAAKLIYQTARGARALAGEIADHKTISSFPEIIDILSEADRIAIDSPQKFSWLCHRAAEIMDVKAVELEEEREDFVNGLSSPLPKKGLVDE